MKTLNSELAVRLRRLRVERELTQQELADRVGTTASVISRLENPLYRGHSLSMLQRVARHLNARVDVRLTIGPAREPLEGRGMECQSIPKKPSQPERLEDLILEGTSKNSHDNRI